MGKDAPNSTTADLRRLATGGETVGFATQIRMLLEADFGHWFRILKEQKLVGHFRCVETIRQVRQLILGNGFRATASDALELEHHFNVCEFMQVVFDQIDKETAGLPCSVAHPIAMARAVARLVEISNYALQKRITPGTGPFADGISMLELASMEQRGRDVLEAGNIILNSKAAKSGGDADYRVSDGELDDLLRLAFSYDEMRKVLDLYTYKGAGVRIKRKSLIVDPPEMRSEAAAMVGAERSCDYDQIRANVLVTVSLNVDTECQTIDVNSDQSFFNFLCCVENSSAAAAARHFGAAFATDLQIEISQFFDLSVEVTTRSGTFTLIDLIRTWAFLGTIVMLGQRWNERIADTVNVRDKGKHPRRPSLQAVRNVPTPELPRGWLVRMLSREASLTPGQASRLINQFTSRPGTDRIDLFYKPLVLLPEGSVLLPTPYIRGSRFDRNVFALIATETDLDQKRKGYLPIPDLALRFEEAGFRSVANFRVRIQHKELTDIDIVAFKDGILFIGQCKIVIQPDTLYDTWKAEGKLDVAARQLEICEAHIHEVRKALLERLRIDGTAQEPRLFPFIVTNTRQFTERRFRGYPVVDIYYLRFILSGARQTVVSVQNGGLGVASGRSYIAGDVPSGEELSSLLLKTIHNVRDREVAYQHVMRKIGDRKVHLPILGMRTAGESRYVFNQEDIVKAGPFRRLR